jgi:hypothetical protein
LNQAIEALSGLGAADPRLFLAISMPKNRSSTKEHRSARSDQSREKAQGKSSIAGGIARQFGLGPSMLCLGPHLDGRQIALISGSIGGNPKPWIELQKQA